MGRQGELRSLATMVVDDDPFVVNLLCDLLGEIGVADVRTATTGDTALLELRGRRCDLIISDLAMPGMDGVELLRHLAALEDKPAVILVSAMKPRVLQAAHQLAASRKLHIAGVLTKPVRRAELVQSLTAVVEGTQVELPSAVVGSGTSNFTSMEVSADELSQGLIDGRLQAYFQPIVRCATGRAVAAEALARWRHPSRGVLATTAFLGVAERCGCVDEVTRQVMNRAFEQAGTWHRRGVDIGLSLNLSVLDLEDPGLVDALGAAAAEYGVPISSVTIEVTESRIVERLTAAFETFTRLRVHGFGIALDDFAIGNTGAEQAARLPVTQLKLDPLLVNGAAADPERRGRIAAAVALAEQLDLQTVAEGIEHPDDLEIVTELGIHLAQGRMIAAPMPPDKLAGWLKRRA